jgi:hypothetical protein
MTNIRIAVWTLTLLGMQVSTYGQSVVSTHSGVVYFFAGSVFIGGERLEQKFGRFPDIGEGAELRTEQGRAEVLLTPGVVIRVAENSAIRMISNKLSDTRVELLKGSTILESNDVRKDTSATLVYRKWEVRVPHDGVYRIDASPAQLKAYKGEVQVVADGSKSPVTVKEGDVLPLAEVLLTDRAIAAEGDSFKNWAMNRSEVIAADNATAAGIIDDPSQFDTAGLAAGGFTYFPPTGMSSALGVNNPYGVSFWSSYQSMLNSIYFPPYVSYSYWPVRGWPISNGSPVGTGSGWTSGLHGGVRPIINPIHQPPVVGWRPTGTVHPTAPTSGLGRTIPLPTPAHVATPVHPVGGHAPAHR